jgi:hypothetical protein
MKNILITGGPVHAHLDAVKMCQDQKKSIELCIEEAQFKQLEELLKKIP